MPLGESLVQAQLRHPVQLRREPHRIRFQPSEHGFPAIQDVIADVVAADGIQTMALRILPGQVQVLPLDVDGPHATAVDQFDQPRQGGVEAHLTERRHWHERRQGLRHEVVVDHRQHQRGRAHLEVRLQLAHVGVADDDVQSPILARVGVRLIAGVDDRPLERGL